MAAMDPVALTSIINLGAVGVIAALGIVFAKGAYQREKELSDKKDLEIKELTEKKDLEIKELNEQLRLQQREYLPVLTSSNRALEESASALKASQAIRDELARKGVR